MDIAVRLPLFCKIWDKANGSGITEEKNPSVIIIFNLFAGMSQEHYSLTVT